MKELVISGINVKIAEYKGVKVLTSFDIALLHGREVRRVTEQFQRSAEYFEENLDFFLVSREEFPESLFATQTFLPNNVRVLRLFTERGYLKLCKTLLLTRILLKLLAILRRTFSTPSLELRTM